MMKPLAFAALSLLLPPAVLAGVPQSAPKPVSASEVLALVAGGALPESIVREISRDGLAFRPDDGYRTLLKTAAADPTILAALDSAKVTADAPPDSQSGRDFLLHIANTSALLHHRKYEEAAKEMLAVTVPHLPCPECGFIMGQVFVKIEAWDQAESVYRKVLSESPGFPEAHAKLAFVLHRAERDKEAQTEARAALQQDPDDAEAHKNAGLALMGMHDFPGALGEYRQALRLKPNYQSVHYDLGVLFGLQENWGDAISEYRTAIRLAPDDVDAIYNLGNALDAKGDYDTAILAYRDAKRLDPTRYDVRQNLGAELMNHGHAAESVSEFRELVKLYPDSQMAAYSLALGLLQTSQLDEAATQFKKLAEADPSDPKPHQHLGEIYETQLRDNDALKEYGLALQIDPTTAEALKGTGRILLRKHEYARAAEELKQAAQLMIGDADTHAFYAAALIGTGNLDAAIDEFKQAVALDPKKLQVMIQLGTAYEERGDWPDALDAYHRAAAADASIDMRGKIIRMDDRDPQKEYSEAKKRFDAHVAGLRAAGHVTEAVALEARVKDSTSKEGVSAQIDSAMQSGVSATRQRRFGEGRQYFQKAIDLEDQLQPHDTRLITALDCLGMTYVGEDSNAAQAAFERELKVAVEIYGPQSASLTGPLQSLGNNALMQKDYASAAAFFFRAVDLNEKFFGEGSNRVADSLVQASAVYFVQKDYAKAEPYLLRALHIDESLYGKDSIDLLVPLSTLCQLYDRWDQPDKTAPCDQHLVTILEKQYGTTSPVLVTTLAGESGALRKIGHTQEADKLDQRIAQIRSATMTPSP